VPTYLHTYLPTHIFICLFNCVSTCLSIQLSTCLSGYLFIHTSVSLSIYLSALVSICLVIYLTICLYFTCYLFVCPTAYLRTRWADISPRILIMSCQNVLLLVPYQAIFPKYFLPYGTHLSHQVKCYRNGTDSRRNRNNENSGYCFNRLRTYAFIELIYFSRYVCMCLMLMCQSLVIGQSAHVYCYSFL
jgi:hypothetical protein